MASKQAVALDIRRTAYMQSNDQRRERIEVKGDKVVLFVRGFGA